MQTVIVYIVSCADDSFHIGSTTNLNDRIAFHNSGLHLLTSAVTPVKLHYSYSFRNVLDASSFELALGEISQQEIAEINASDWAKKTIIKIESQMNSISPASTYTKELPCTYLGNISYFNHLINVDFLVLDSKETFQKQSYRNRTTLLAANGLQNLIVPIERPFGKESKMDDILISYAEDWQKNHIRTIESAYRKTPFYEYYASDLFAILTTKYEKLIDLNLALLQFLCKKLNINCLIRLSEIPLVIDHQLKNELLPKNRTAFNTISYTQAFNKTGGFESNLSILDVLFNEGPNAIKIITKSCYSSTSEK